MSKRSLSPSHFLHISSSKKFPFSSQLTILNCYYCFSSIFILVFSLSNVFENVSEKPENSLFRNARGGEAIRAGGQVRWRDKCYKWYYQKLRSPLLMEWSAQLLKSNQIRLNEIELRFISQQTEHTYGVESNTLLSLLTQRCFSFKCFYAAVDMRVCVLALLRLVQSVITIF